MAESEVERKAFRENVILALTGAIVQVKGGTFGDKVGGPLTDDGAAAVLDRLASRGFRVVRAE